MVCPLFAPHPDSNLSYLASQHEQACPIQTLASGSPHRRRSSKPGNLFFCITERSTRLTTPSTFSTCGTQLTTQTLNASKNDSKKAVEASVYCITLEKAQPSKEGSDKVKVKALHCTKHINSYKSKDFLLPLPQSSNAWQEIGGFDPPLKVEDRSLELGKQSYVVCFEPFFLEFNANEEIEVS